MLGKIIKMTITLWKVTRDEPLSIEKTAIERDLGIMI